MPKKFDKLEKTVEAEYRKKGFSPERARAIGYATAGKVFREKQGRK